MNRKPAPKTVPVRIDRETWKLLSIACKRKDRSIQCVVTEAVKAYWPQELADARSRVRK